MKALKHKVSSQYLDRQDLVSLNGEKMNNRAGGMLNMNKISTETTAIRMYFELPYVMLS